MSTGLSPNDIRNYEFSNQMRGYDKDEVKELLEQVAVTLENLKQENLKLSMQADSYKSQLDGVRQFESAIKDATIDARRNADATIANAKKEAAEITARAQKEMNEAIGSRETKIKQIQEQLTKLEMTRTSYVTKLRDMIESHRDLINDITQLKMPSIPDMPTTTDRSSMSTAAAAAVAATMPSNEEQSVETPQPTTQSDPQVETSFGSLNPFDEPDPLNSSNRIEVEESSEVSRHRLETIGSSNVPEALEMTEEANAPSRIVAVESDAAQEDSPLDPELAAALESYQAAHQDTPELNHTEETSEVTAARADGIPSEFIPVGDDTVKTTAAKLAETSTGKTQTPNGDEESTEHNAIDIDQPVGQKKPHSDVPPAPEEIAQELDAVAAKFEEEMDRAARS